MRSNQTPLRSAFLCILFFILQLHAEPANLLVGNLTFTRPENWRWEEPTRTSTALTRFVLGNPRLTAQTDIRFYIVNKNVASEKAVLLSQFPGSTAADISETSLKVGAQKLIYLRIAGTYRYHEGTPKPDYVVLGAQIPTGTTQYIYAKMMGPRAEVEGSVSAFKKMVEDAIRERDVN
jgi:hypothetical protein